MKRTDIVMLIGAKNCNPNGDPDGDNRPRTTPDFGTGLISKGAISRKIRNYIQSKYGAEPGCDIYVKAGAILGQQRLKALTKEGVPLPANDAAKKINPAGREAVLHQYYDVRCFGGVLSGSKAVNCGQVTGPVQITMLESIDPITHIDLAISRCAAETEDEVKKSIDGTSKTLGSVKAMAYGLYKGVLSVNPILAAETGFSDSDFDKLKEALLNLFAIDGSAARPPGSMVVEALFMYEHSSEYGNAQTGKLLRKVKVERKVENPASVDDYSITLDTDLSDGVVFTRLL